MNLPLHPSREYVSPNELEAITGFATKTLEDWRREKRGPRYFKIGRHIKYPLREAIEWIETHEGKA